jgi:hypothetical protein
MGPRGFVNPEAAVDAQLRERSCKIAPYPGGPPHESLMEALLMLKIKTGLRFGNLLLGAFLVAGLAGPAFAGNVYSWVTEDGTYAFTDDSKRIPAKHRAEVTKKSMGKLTRYERFTEVSSESGKPHADRIRERQMELRQMAAGAPMGAIASAIGGQGKGIVYSIPVTGNGRNSGTAIDVPVGNGASASDRPTVISDIRVKPRHSMATRHWTVVKNGDRIVTVIKGELNQRPLKSKSESDFDL